MQLRMHLVDEPYLQNDGTHWVDEILSPAISRRWSRLSQNLKLAQI